MRVLTFALILTAPSLGACGTSAYSVGGTVDYALSPAAGEGAAGGKAAGSGALPLTILYCPAVVDYTSYAVTRPRLVRLGPGCVLDLAHPGGTCDLPTETGPLRISVESTSAALTQSSRSVGPPLNVVVGGTSLRDGRYATYRFTGSDMKGGTDRECEEAARALSKRVVLANAQTVANQDYWSAWENGAPAAGARGPGR
jgi:hypothetical protein